LTARGFPVPSLTYKPGNVEIAVPFNQIFIDQIKAAIPSQYRSWDPEYRLWKVWSPYVKQARTLVMSLFENVVEVNTENFDSGPTRQRSEYSSRRETGDEDLFERVRRQQHARQGGRTWTDSEQAARDRATQRAASGDHAMLGVLPDAPLEVIDAAYRALAKKHHPDRGTGDTEKMQEINAAYARIRRENR
jgi:hypothetical protein